MLNNSDYGKKTDIYSLGVVFHKLCFNDYPNSKQYISNISRDNFQGNEKMIQIIEKMLSDENKRPNANELYNLILHEYLTVLNHNSSIESVLRCLSSYKKTSKRMLENQAQFLQTKTPYAFNFLKCIQTFKSKEDKIKCREYLNDIRNEINKNEGIINMDMDIEINPLLVFDSVLEGLIRETNSFPQGFSLKIQPFEFEQDKNKSNSNFINWFSQNYGSDFSKYFCGGLKTKRNCKNCPKFGYNFCAIPYLEFQLDRCYNKNNQFLPNISDWIFTQFNHGKYLNKEYNIVCASCKSQLEEFKQFEPLQKHLVIAINRGEGYINKSKVEFPLKLILSNFVYNLIGIVKRISDENSGYFISINLDYEDGKTWIISDKETLNSINDPFSHSIGDVILLFYSLE